MFSMFSASDNLIGKYFPIRLRNIKDISKKIIFQAIDKDGSGSIDQSELSKLGGKMTKVSGNFFGIFLSI